MTRSCVVILIFCAWQSSGQDINRFDVAVPAHAVRFSPFHLLNFYPTVQAGYEFRVKDRVTLYTEGGYVINITDDERFLNKRGFKAKLEPRYYVSVNRKGNITWYFAGELYYNHIDFDRREFRTECFDIECQQLYQRKYFEKGTHREKGFGIKGGLLIYMRDFFFDFNTGFAVRFIDYDLPEPGRAFLLDDQAWFEIPNETDRTGVMPLLGIRVGYRIGPSRRHVGSSE